MSTPDGVVDPGGKTLAALNGSSSGSNSGTPMVVTPLPNPPKTTGTVTIPDTKEINRDGAWAKRDGASKIIATPEEVQAVMAKIKDPNSPAYWASVPTRQKATTFGEMDNYLKAGGVEGYIKGKALVARPSMNKSSLDKIYGFIDESKLPENESGSDPQRKAFEAKYITYVTTPYPLNGGRTTKLPLHKLVAGSFVAALNEVLAFYGLEMIQKLGIDLCAGGFVFRLMRGSTRASIHAYGCAVDFASTFNKLSDDGANSLFSQGPYSAFLDIMEKYGWHNQGRNKDNDFMHFQAAAY